MTIAVSKYRLARLAVTTAAVFTFAAACSETPTAPNPQLNLNCTVPQQDVRDAGIGRDTIPALTNPDAVQFGDPGLFYIDPSEHVLGILLDDTPLAIPFNLLWWHEIVNMNFANQSIAVTYSPFTGSALVFDRTQAAVEGFEVSEYLFKNNLVMRDVDTESLWPQMSRGARCGERAGWDLDPIPAFQTTWRAWLNLHPDTWAVSSVTGFDRFYTLYPYGDYADLNNTLTPFPTDLDTRRPPKELVLGIPMGTGGIAFPFGKLAEQNLVSINETEVNGERIVVFWNWFANTAVAYQPIIDGLELHFEVVEGIRRDVETGTSWNLEGWGYDGPLSGKKLQQVEDAYVSFWFAWADFHPNTEIWGDQPVP